MSHFEVVIEQDRARWPPFARMCSANRENTPPDKLSARTTVVLEGAPKTRGAGHRPEVEGVRRAGHTEVHTPHSLQPGPYSSG